MDGVFKVGGRGRGGWERLLERQRANSSPVRNNFARFSEITIAGIFGSFVDFIRYIQIHNW